MKTQEISRRIQKLDHLFLQADLFKDNLEIHAQWAKYLCVLVSGFLETSIRALYVNYAIARSNGNVSNFVERNLDWFQNAKTVKIIELARSFNGEWGDELEALIIDELKASIDSIVNNRHKIAHGEDVSITYKAVKDHYINIIRTLEAIEDQCLRK